MKTDDELLELIGKYLYDAGEELWDALSPEERRKVFGQLINEYVSITW